MYGLKKIKTRTYPNRKFRINIEIKLFLVIIISIFQIYTVNAQTSLDYYLEKAYSNNPSIHENQNVSKINEKEKQLINAQYSSSQISLSSYFLFAPNINPKGQLIFQPTADAIGYDPAITNGGEYSLLLNFQKNLFNSGTISAYQKEFDAVTERSLYDINATKHQIAGDVTAQYLKCLQNLKLYQINNDLIKLIENELIVIKELVDNGLGKQTDYLQLSVEASNLKLNSRQILSSYFTELVQLNSLTGISDTSFKMLEPANLKQSDKIAKSNFSQQYRLDSIKTATLQIASDAKYNPNLNVFCNVGLNAVEISNMYRKFGFSAGLNFNLVLYDGDQKLLTHQKTDLMMMNIESYKSNSMTQRDNQLAIAAKQIQLNRSMLEDIRMQIVIYQNLMNALRTQLSTGQLSVVDYLTTLRNFLELQKTEATTEIAVQLAINDYNYWNW